MPMISRDNLDIQVRSSPNYSVRSPFRVARATLTLEVDEWSVASLFSHLCTGRLAREHGSAHEIAATEHRLSRARCVVAHIRLQFIGIIGMGYFTSET